MFTFRVNHFHMLSWSGNNTRELCFEVVKEVVKDCYIRGFMSLLYDTKESGSQDPEG